MLLMNFKVVGNDCCECEKKCCLLTFWQFYTLTFLMFLSLVLTTPNVQLKVQFAELLSAEGLLTAIRRIFGPQEFLAIWYSYAKYKVLYLTLQRRVNAECRPHPLKPKLDKA